MAAKCGARGEDRTFEVDPSNGVLLVQKQYRDEETGDHEEDSNSEISDKEQSPQRTTDAYEFVEHQMTEDYQSNRDCPQPIE